MQEPDRVREALGSHRILHQDRDDLAHDILAAALQSWRKRGAEVVDPERWLNGIILNHIRRWRRRRAVELTRSEQEKAAGGESEAVDKGKNPEEVLMDVDRRRILYQLLDELPVDHLDAVVAHELDELTFEEIATAFERPVSTVYGYYQAGMRELRAAYKRWKAKQRGGGALLLLVPLESFFQTVRATPERPAPTSGPRRTPRHHAFHLKFTLPAMGYLLAGQPHGEAGHSAGAPLDSAAAIVAQAAIPAATAVGAQVTAAANPPPSAPPGRAPGNTSPSSTARLPAIHARRVEPASDHDAFVADQTAFDIARAAYFQGDMLAATKGLAAHAQKYPGSRNALEREQMWIESLVSLGHTTEACRRAESFRRAYPKSPLPAALGRLCW